MISFFSSGENRSPALGRITMLSFPAVLLLTSTWVLGEENSRTSLFLDEKSSLRVCVDDPGCILIEILLEPVSYSYTGKRSEPVEYPTYFGAPRSEIDFPSMERGCLPNAL